MDKLGITVELYLELFLSFQVETTAIMANGEAAESGLQDKLRDQVSSSVREALSKSTTILSNLHRLSSYLDVMSAVSGQCC